MKQETLLQHLKSVTPTGSNKPLLAPVHFSTKYTFDTYEEIEALFNGEAKGYLYSRTGNPTVRSLELALAKIQETEDGICFSSGVAAISNFMLANLTPGEHFLTFLEGYKPTRTLTRNYLTKFGIKTDVVSCEDWERIESLITKNKTKFVHFESPTNPQMKYIDFDRLFELKEKYKFKLIMDNTFAGPHQNKFPEIDFYIHSLTKYVTGTGDTMGGALLGPEKELWEMRPLLWDLGACLDPHSAHRAMIGLKTYLVRYRHAGKTALSLSKRLLENKNLSLIMAPKMTKGMRDPVPVFMIALKGGLQAAKKFMNSLETIQVAGSLGSTETLVAPCDLFYATDLSENERRLSTLPEGSIRFSIGLEDEEDLYEEIIRALEIAHGN